MEGLSHAQTAAPPETPVNVDPAGQILTAQYVPAYCGLHVQSDAFAGFGHPCVPHRCASHLSPVYTPGQSQAPVDVLKEPGPQSVPHPGPSPTNGALQTHCPPDMVALPTETGHGPWSQRAPDQSDLQTHPRSGSPSGLIDAVVDSVLSGTQRATHIPVVAFLV